MNHLQTIIEVVGGLAVFLFGMKIMSEGLQKVAGPKMRKTLSVMTGNRFSGVITGFLVTCAVQSSSATTVMLVGFVHAGLITLTQSIGVIMGANIGTTFTGWLVALIGFKFKITVLALPAVAIGFFVRFVKSRTLTEWGEFLIGFGILFLGLEFMKEAVEELRQSETLLSWVGLARADVLGWRLVTVGIGTAVTLLVQSSSATMAITMTLAAQGIITLETACALVIGENIGTTVTANLAAIEASTSAKRAARAHFIFNIFGAVWAVVLFVPFFKLINLIMPGHAAGDGAGLSPAAIAARLAMFHSTFNIINTGLFLPFANQLAWVASKLVKTPSTEEKRGLVFIDPSFVGMPPTAILAARSELTRMLDEVGSMLQRVLMLISSPDKKLGKVAEAVAASEEIVDNLEKEITAYLVDVSRLEVSERQSREIAGIINAAHDIERIGDHCEVLLRLLRRAYDEKRQFSETAIGEAIEIGELVQRFIALVRKNVSELSPALMEEAHVLEDSIDEKRKLMRQEHITRLREGKCEVEQGLIFIDMLTSFEKIGDHSFNIAEVLAGQKQKLLPQER
jgi:phosphate:Na+ symporter